jgi:hypothetical protein
VLAVRSEHPGEAEASLFACHRDRREAVAIGSSNSAYGNGTAIEALAADRHWVLTREAQFDRYNGRGPVELVVVDGRTGEPRLVARTDSADGAGRPDGGEPIAVTDAGRLTWLQRRRTAERVVGYDADGKLVILDRGAPGTISGLRAEGDEVVWSSGGAERRVRP